MRFAWTYVITTVSIFSSPWFAAIKILFFSSRELGNGVRGSRYNDSARFFQCKMAATNQRSFAFENLSYAQTIDLGANQTFTPEFNVQMRYRTDVDEPLAMTSEFILI